MPRRITVKGIDEVSTKPNFIVLFMKLEAKDRKYDKAMDMSQGKWYRCLGYYCKISSTFGIENFLYRKGCSSSKQSTSV